MSAWGNNQQPSPWEVKTPKNEKPWFDESDVNKRLFGIELAKGVAPFEAAQKIFPIGNGVTVWVAQNWLSDPVVIAAKDEYLKNLNAKSGELDKDAYLAKILEFVDATYETSTGQKVYVNEGKDRLAALHLYGKAAGFVDNKAQTEVSNTIHNNTNNFVGIKLVKAENKELIPDVPNIKSKILNEETALPPLKLVSGGG